MAVTRSKLWAGLLIGGAATAAAVAGYAFYFRPRHLRWGATDEEVKGPWPGDEIAPAATSICTHAITIDAPPSAVWPWIVQIGQDRAGFYSYSWLENLVGAQIHNVEHIMPEFQDRKVGDTMWLGPKFRYGGEARLMVARLDPQEAMVLVPPDDFEQLLEGRRAQGCWSFILEGTPEGTTRLIMRGRGRPAGFLQVAMDKVVFEPAHFIMERKMMLTIKRLVERGPVAPTVLEPEKALVAKQATTLA